MNEISDADLKEISGYSIPLSTVNVTFDVGDLAHELLSLRSLNKRLVADGERLASTYVVEVFPHEWACRGGCHHGARFGEQIDHTPDCPITLHRALMKEVGK